MDEVRLGFERGQQWILVFEIKKHKGFIVFWFEH
jgi:hypothetical protein